MLKKIQEALGIWRSELNKLERELEKQLQRLAFLQESPLPAEDLADLVVSRMTDLSKHYFDMGIERKLGAMLRKPLMDWGWKGAESESGSRFFPAFISAGSKADGIQMFWPLREILGPAIRKAIVEWPDYPTAGPPLAERLKEIAKLEKAIPKLQEQIESSRAEAAAVGVDASELHQRAPVPKRIRDIKK